METPRYVQVDDYEPVAKANLPVDVYGFYAGGAGDERTLEENRLAFDRWVLRPRVLRASATPDTTTEILGTRVASPVLVAPWAYQWMAHADGERATARGVARAGTIFVVSSTAVEDLEGISAASDGPKWWQLYLFAEQKLSADMLHRVVDAGYGAICWTVDLPVVGLRHRDARSGFVMPLGPNIGDFDFEPNLTWDQLDFIREHASGLPVLVKGILRGDDAALACERGVDGIVVSNHGGRQLDGCIASLDALPEVVEAVGGRVPILMDGGVRRGTDVLKAIALGAQAVLVGRPIAWGLAAEGEEGVASVLEILRAEVENAMALAGCRVVSDIERDLVAPAPA